MEGKNHVDTRVLKDFFIQGQITQVALY